ncbi:MAG: GTPase SAR1 family protein [Rubritalea sp.]
MTNTFLPILKYAGSVSLKKEGEGEAKDDLVNLVIWDTEGTDNVKKTRKAYLLRSQGLLYVEDVNRPKIGANLIEHKEYLKTRFCNVPIITVGNKNDLVPKGSIAKERENEIFRHAPKY